MNRVYIDLEYWINNLIVEGTEENVEMVLDEMRPFLIQDGGNVAIQEIDGLSSLVEGLFLSLMHMHSDRALHKSGHDSNCIAPPQQPLSRVSETKPGSSFSSASCSMTSTQTSLAPSAMNCLHSI